MREKFTLLLSLFGLVGLVLCILVLSMLIQPTTPLSLVLWFSLAAYAVIIMLMLTGFTLIEMLTVILLFTIILVAAVFTMEETISDNTRLLMWSVVVGAWYTPVFVLSLARILGIDETDSQESHFSDEEPMDSDRQRMIDKSLARRKRKLARRKR